MSWLCDLCGYENEFNDEDQPTSCNCCGEPASEETINAARREWQKYCKEEKRQLRLNKRRRRKELLQRRLERGISGVICSFKAVSIASVVVFVLSLGWVVVSMVSEKVVLSELGEQLKSNVTELSCIEYPGIMKDNLSTMDIKDKAVEPFTNSWEYIPERVATHFSVATENITEGSNDKDSYYSDNIQGIKESVKEQLERFGDNVSNDDYIEKTEDTFENIGENWHFFIDNIETNVDELIDDIKSKRGDNND